MTATSTATTPATNWPSDPVKIFADNPSPATPLDTDTLKKGFQPNQVISADEFNQVMGQVQRWTAYLEAERKGLSDRLSTVKTNFHTFEQDLGDLEKTLEE